MNNYRANGDHIAFTNTGSEAIKSGQGHVLGSIFGVAAADIPVNELGVLIVAGSFELPKAGSQAWAIGDPVYWDQDAGVATTVAEGNVLIGVAVETSTALATAVRGVVRLNGVSH